MGNHSIKIAFRNLQKHKIFSMINIVGLGVGMAFAILMLLWVQYQVSYDRFHENTDQLYMAGFSANDNTFFSDYSIGALAEYLENEIPEIKYATRFSNPEGYRFDYNGKSIYGHGRFVDPSFLKMFSFPFIEGNPETALSEPYSVVITEDLADRIFGDDDPIGQMVAVSDKTSLKVTGILKDVPNNTQFHFEYLVSCEIGPDVFNKWDVKSIKVFAMLEENQDYLAVSEKIKDVYNDRNLQDTKNDYLLRPLKDVHMYNMEGGGLITYVIIFSIAAIAVLLMACINFMNLSTARSEKRAKEIGIKKINGASRTRLIFQFLGESIIYSFLALILAAFVVELMLPFVNAMLGTKLGLDYSGIISLSLIGIALLTGIVSGSYPAFFLSSFPPITVLKGQSSERYKGSGLRRVLIITQFTISIIFISSVVVIFSQLNHVRNMDIGFEKENIVLFNMPGQLIPKTTTIKNELLKHSNIQNVTVSANSLVEWWTSFGVHWEGKADNELFDVGFNAVDYDFLETFQMEIVEGRFFSKDFPSDAQEAYVINETLAKKMGLADPIGKKISMAPGSSIERKGKIIGVIKDFNTESMHKEIRPFIMGLSPYGRFMCVRIAPENIRGTKGFIKNKISELAPDVSIWLRFFNDEMSRSYQIERLTGALIIYITFLAIFIACIGLYGLASFSAEKRTKEIGIRKIMGASIMSILKLIMKEFVILIIIASVIAYPISYLIMDKWLENFVFRIGISPWLFGFVTLLILIVALISVSSQMFRVAYSNPIKAIKYE